MSIWTSNFATCGRLPDAVSISRGKPGWFDGRSFDVLAPSWSWIKNYQCGVWDWNQYTEAYNSRLLKMEAENVCATLGDGAILLCFCVVPKENCHRRLVAEWMERECGLVVSERSQQSVEQLSFSFK